MKNLLSLAFTICILFLFSNKILAQSSKTVFFDQPVAKGITNVISTDGKIMWNLDREHFPQFGQEQETFLPFSYLSYRTFDFAKGPLPIKKGVNTYLVNYAGNKVKDFGNEYRKIYPALDGLLLATKQNPEDRKYLRFVFLKADGSKAFGETEFHKATPFINGHAIVQMENEKGPWGIIDASGKKVAELPENITPHISKINPFYNGLALVTTRKPKGYDPIRKITQHFYINTKGEVVIDVTDIKPDAWYRINAFNFKDGIGYCKYSREFIFFNTKGEILFENQSLKKKGLLNISKEYVLLDAFNYRERLYDHSFKVITLPTEKNEIFLTLNIQDGFIAVAKEDTTSKQGYFEILEAKTFKSIARYEKMDIGFTDDRIFFGSKKDFRTSLTHITDFSGKNIYNISTENRLFTSVKEAMEFKNKVRNIELKDDPDLNLLSSFSNLESLNLIRSNATNLPDDLGKCKNLESINLMRCDGIQQLPTSLKGHTKLKKLNINNCKNMSGLEELIESMPALESVFTENYTFRKGFKKEMETKNPKLKIQAWSSLQMEFEDHDVSEEPSVVPAPAPPAPPRKRKN